MIRAVGVVGCGLMGSGIAEVAALAGLRVVAVKATAGSVDGVRARLEASFARAVTRGKRTAEECTAAMGRIALSSDIGTLADCDLVIESTAEELASKKKHLAAIEAVVGAQAILATNTSSLPLRELGRDLMRPERFVGMHFFSPVAAMDLVEVGRTEESTAEVVEGCVNFVRALGKTPILLQGEPGYLVNRLLVPQLCQAIEMLGANVARATEIDLAMKKGLGHPMGPLGLADAIGLDVVLAMAETLEVELGDPRFRVPPLLRRLVLAGYLGKKTKVGLFVYSGAEPSENPAVTAV